MINYLQGKIVKTLENALILDMNGFGIKILVSQNALNSFHKKHPHIPADEKIFTHLNIGENKWECFGFLEEAEREAFLILLSCRGVGPKGAINILNTLSPSDLYSVASGREGALKLKQIPGVGAKSAERIAIELKNQIQKMEDLRFNNQKKEGAGLSYTQADLYRALQNLGYRTSEIQIALSQMSSNLPLSLSEAVRELLKVVGKR